MDYLVNEFIPVILVWILTLIPDNLLHLILSVSDFLIGE